MKLRFAILFLILGLPLAVAAQNAKAVKYKKLPPNVTSETAVWGKIVRFGADVLGPERTTVEKRLRELKARYRKNVLVDAKGREIRFWEPLCRGVSAGQEEDEAERKAREEELTKLESKFTVIMLICDPAKVSFEFRRTRFRPDAGKPTRESLL